MLFNSLDFAVYLPIVFVLYWFVGIKSLKTQNILLVIASYIFDGWWDWLFLSLIFISTLVDFTLSLGLIRQHNEFHRKIILGVSLAVNLGILGVFKYYNFFIDNLIDASTIFGRNFEARSLDI